jgi:GT2 family glycosyltransferase
MGLSFRGHVMGLDLGIVIVNYNVRDLLRESLASLFEGGEDLTMEVCVVDNASQDGSADMVASEYPQVRLIRTENRGYAVGNNLGLKTLGFTSDKGDGSTQPRYALLLNPDTVMPPSALANMVTFMEEHPEAGVAGPRLVRQDGSLDKACRRSFPTPEIAAYRMLGLSKLFPRSQRFGRYNVTYLPPDMTSQVDSVVGAFMLIRDQVLAQVGLLDERFFMYAEDLDFCYRAKELGWQVWYNADVTVLHYKGQSSRQRSHFANVQFYRTMRLFHDKHFKQQTFFLVNWLIYAAVGALQAGALLRNRLRPADKRGVASAVPLSTAPGYSGGPQRGETPAGSSDRKQVRP